MVEVGITGITDPDGDTVSVRITGITQSEPTEGAGDGNTCPDASGEGTSTALLRAERSGGGSGRLYVIEFTAEDGKGGTATGSVTVTVPKSASKPATDSGLRFALRRVQITQPRGTSDSSESTSIQEMSERGRRKTEPLYLDLASGYVIPGDRAWHPLRTPPRRCEEYSSRIHPYCRARRALFSHRPGGSSGVSSTARAAGTPVRSHVPGLPRGHPDLHQTGDGRDRHGLLDDDRRALLQRARQGVGPRRHDPAADGSALRRRARGLQRAERSARGRRHPDAEPADERHPPLEGRHLRGTGTDPVRRRQLRAVRADARRFPT